MLRCGLLEADQVAVAEGRPPAHGVKAGDLPAESHNVHHLCQVPILLRQDSHPWTTWLIQGHFERQPSAEAKSASGSRIASAMD